MKALETVHSLRKLGDIDDVYFVIGVAATGHERERVLASPGLS